MKGLEQKHEFLIGSVRPSLGLQLQNDKSEFNAFCNGPHSSLFLSRCTAQLETERILQYLGRNPILWVQLFASQSLLKLIQMLVFVGLEYDLSRPVRWWGL